MKAADDEIGILRREELVNALTHGFGAIGSVAAAVIGTPFYHNDRLRYAHALWHLFVLAGSVCHVLAVATLL